MPQHLLQTRARTAIPLDVQGRQLLAAHDQLTAILKGRLGQAHGDLLAKPKAGASGAVQCGRRRRAGQQPARRAPPAPAPARRTAAERHPRAGAASCLAQITGGRVFTAHNADQVAAMTREASREAMGPANCPS